MVNTVQGLIVIVIALLPGALATWSFERQAGAWGLDASDRLMRFIGSSAIFHALAAPLTWYLVHQVRSSVVTSSNAIPWPLWLVPLGYVAMPWFAGQALGRAVRLRHRWAAPIVGPAPAPRAWDHVFAGGQSAWVRIRLKDTGGGTGGWITGTFAPSDKGPAGYAAGYPAAQDLYLADTVEVEPNHGRPLLDPGGNAVFRGYGLLIRWDEIAYLELNWT